MSDIFISNRHDDAADVIRRINDHFCNAFVQHKIFTDADNREGFMPRTLNDYLKPLVFAGRLEVFFNTESIEKGSDWEQRIHDQLEQADGFIFLVSRHYFDSTFVIKSELPKMIRRYRDDRVKCWPFCVSQYPWEDFEFEGARLSSIQALGPFDQQERLIPLNALTQHEQDVQLSRVYSEIRDWLDQLGMKQLQKKKAQVEAANIPQTDNSKNTSDQSVQTQQSPQHSKKSATSLGQQRKPEVAVGKTPTGSDRDSSSTVGSTSSLNLKLMIVAGLGVYTINKRQEEEAQRQLQQLQDAAAQEAATREQKLAQEAKDREAAEVRRKEEADKAKAKAKALEVTKHITELLAEANRQIDQNRLTHPPGDNAYETLAAVKRLDPRNPLAIQLRTRIVNRYIKLAKRASDDRQFNDAGSYLDKASVVDANAPALAAARRNLAKAKVEDAARASITRAVGKKTANTPQAVAKPGSVFQDRLRIGGKGPEMVIIPAGSFMMGSPDSEKGRTSDEDPQHQVRIESFALGKTEVTFDEYDAFAKATGRELPADEGWVHGKRPVINVSWTDAIAYAEWLSEQTGTGYQLTEAEWEYAARGGTTTAYPWGRRPPMTIPTMVKMVLVGFSDRSR